MSGTPLTDRRFADFLPRPVLLIVFTAAFATYGLLGPSIFASPDTSWHLAAGDWILAHRKLPETDPWSYTAGNTRWIDISWLWDVLISTLFQHFGPKGLFCFTCGASALTITVLCACMLRRGEAYDEYIVFVATLAWFSQWTALQPLPQLVTCLFVPIFHYIVHSYRRDGAVDRRRTLQLAGMMALWVNLHGGFIAGFTILAAYAAEAYMARDFPRLRALLITTALCVCACLINPYHVHIFEGVMRSLSTRIAPVLLDWHPMTFTDPALAAPMAFFILLAVSTRKLTVPTADRILFAAWLIAAFYALRNVVLFTLISSPYMAAATQELARRKRGDKFRGVNIFPDDAKARIRCSLMAVIICIVVSVVWLQGEPEKSSEYNPSALRDAIRAVQADYPKTRFLNDYNIGGALILATQGAWPVFADGRAGTAYPESVLQDVIDFLGLEERAANVIRKYDIHGLILLRTHPRAMHPPKPWQWKLIYSDTWLVAYIRQ